MGGGPGKDGVLNIGVSFDGSWHKREHSFYTGIGAAVDILTGYHLHSQIWRLCPKTNYAGKRTVEIATCLGLCQFSMSSTCKSVLFQEMGLSLGAYLINERKGKSLERIQKAEKVCDEVVKKRRRRLQYCKSSSAKGIKAKGGDKYKAGSF